MQSYHYILRVILLVGKSLLGTSMNVVIVNISMGHDQQRALISVLKVKPVGEGRRGVGVGGKCLPIEKMEGSRREVGEAKGNYEFQIVLFIPAFSEAPHLFILSSVTRKGKQERISENETLCSCCKTTFQRPAQNLAVTQNYNVFYSNAIKLPLIYDPVYKLYMIMRTGLLCNFIISTNSYSRLNDDVSPLVLSQGGTF